MLRRTQGFVDRSADSTEAASPRQGGDEGHERSKEVRVPEDALLRGGLHIHYISRGFGYLGGDRSERDFAPIHYYILATMPAV